MAAAAWNPTDAKRNLGGVTDTNVETITSFIMRELKDRELAVFMNAMQVW
jgi:hypothetical protein